MLDKNLRNYWENTQQPWGKLLYKIIRAQLNFSNLKILDFGSGFGITANYLAKNNEVTAIEPNINIVESAERVRENNYTQITGGLDKLKKQESGAFDAVVCHNVLEYVAENERAEILKEFARILKNGGILSLIKHNKPGRIIDNIVFKNNLDEALEMLDGGASASINFGAINYYDPEDLREYFKIEKILGIRTFFAWAPNEVKFDENWQNKIFELEIKVSDIDIYKNIAFLNHVMLKKI